MHVHGVLVQSETGEDALGDARHVAAARLGKRLLKFGVALHDRFPVAFVEGRIDHLRLDGGDLLLEFLELPSLSGQFLFDGSVAFEVPDLGQVSDTEPGGEVNISDVLLLVGNGVEQRGFPCTVVADNADALAVVDDEVDVLEDVHWTEGAVHAFDGDELTSHGPPHTVRHAVCTWP